MTEKERRYRERRAKLFEKWCAEGTFFINYPALMLLGTVLSAILFASGILLVLFTDWNIVPVVLIFAPLAVIAGVRIFMNYVEGGHHYWKELSREKARERKNG